MDSESTRPWEEDADDDPFLLEVLNMTAKHYAEKSEPSAPASSSNSHPTPTSSNPQPPTSSKQEPQHEKPEKPDEVSKLLRVPSDAGSHSDHRGTPDSHARASLESTTYAHPKPLPFSFGRRSSRSVRSTISSTNRPSTILSLSSSAKPAPHPAESPNPTTHSESGKQSINLETLEETSAETMSPATLTRSRNMKAYFEAKYAYVFGLEEEAKAAGVALKSVAYNQFYKYNPLAVIRWRKEQWQRAISSKTAEDEKKWSQRQYRWLVETEELIEHHHYDLQSHATPRESHIKPSKNDQPQTLSIEPPVAVEARPKVTILPKAELMVKAQSLEGGVNLTRSLSNRTVESVASGSLNSIKSRASSDRKFPLNEPVLEEAATPGHLKTIPSREKLAGLEQDGSRQGWFANDGSATSKVAHNAISSLVKVTEATRQMLRVEKSRKGKSRSVSPMKRLRKASLAVIESADNQAKPEQELYSSLFSLFMEGKLVQSNDPKPEPESNAPTVENEAQEKGDDLADRDEREHQTPFVQPFNPVKKASSIVGEKPGSDFADIERISRRLSEDFEKMRKEERAGQEMRRASIVGLSGVVDLETRINSEPTKNTTSNTPSAKKRGLSIGANFDPSILIPVQFPDNPHFESTKSVASKVVAGVSGTVGNIKRKLMIGKSDNSENRKEILGDASETPQLSGGKIRGDNLLSVPKSLSDSEKGAPKRRHSSKSPMRLRGRNDQRLPGDSAADDGLNSSPVREGRKRSVKNRFRRKASTNDQDVEIEISKFPTGLNLIKKRSSNSLTKKRTKLSRRRTKDTIPERVEESGAVYSISGDEAQPQGIRKRLKEMANRKGLFGSSTPAKDDRNELKAIGRRSMDSEDSRTGYSSLSEDMAEPLNQSSEYDRRELTSPDPLTSGPEDSIYKMRPPLAPKPSSVAQSEKDSESNVKEISKVLTDTFEVLSKTLNRQFLQLKEYSDAQETLLVSPLVSLCEDFEVPPPTAVDSNIGFSNKTNLLSRNHQVMLDTVGPMMLSMDHVNQGLEKIQAGFVTSEDNISQLVGRLDELAVEVNETLSRRLKVIEDHEQQKTVRKHRGGVLTEIGYQVLAAVLTIIAFLIWLSYQAVKAVRFLHITANKVGSFVYTSTGRR